ncbi:MAG: hypothetical protein K2G60_04135 [Oscillospiraceae bacterium]|nr:hypothetical protein [Oscillospiraceae bacterium]
MYESKIIIANVIRDKNKKSDTFGKSMYAEKAAEISLGGMGGNNGWKNLFTTEIDFELYVDNIDNSTREDTYGEIMKEGDLQSIIKWLEDHSEILHSRTRTLLAMLKSLNPQEWDELHIVHYGY